MFMFVILSLNLLVIVESVYVMCVGGRVERGLRIHHMIHIISIYMYSIGQ